MNYNNYQYNRTNTSYQGASWANRNNNYGQGAGQANRRMDNQYNSSNWRHRPKRLDNNTQRKKPRLPKFLRQGAPNSKQEGTKNSDGASTPKPNKQPAGQKKQEKEAVGTHMMVVASQYPVEVMTDEQLDSLQADILSAIDKIEVGAFRPQFLECFKKKGALVIDCHNQESIEWLKKSVQTLSPWEGAQFRVIQPGKALVQMIVVHSQYPWEVLDLDQIDSLKAEIIKVVDQLPKDDFVPQFINCYRQRGTLVVDCNDQESADWLKKAVPSLLAWNGPEIFVTDPDHVPSLRYVQISVHDPVEDPERILLRLQHQNKGINTKDWHFVRMKKETDFTKIFVAVKDEVVECLKQKNFTLFLNFGRVNVRNTGKFRPILVKDPKPNEADESVIEGETKDEAKLDDSSGDLTDILTEVDELMTEVESQEKAEGQ